MNTTASPVLLTTADGVATLTLNRPDRLNAQNTELFETALGHLERLAADDSVRVVVLTGQGRAFCAGGDISTMGQASDKSEASLGSPARLSDKAVEAITDLDETIAVIRRAIFALTRSDGLAGSGFRGELDRLIDRHRAVGRDHVRLEITGDVDALPPSHQAQLSPVLNELLSNVERHANAESAVVHIEVGPTHLALTVSDDGEGIDLRAPRGYGLRNLAIRAQLLDGSIEHSPGPDGSDATVVWAVPLDPRLP
ncbi:MAG: enoyl-CoA hydratase/isomerase family protein [Actinomycetota bacterium]|nr:enoyl-CoA hydratase/isomerase family protein [Actinomycetota bacterium]